MEGVQCNCELGDKQQMAPNLISHHLSKLRAVGLVNVAFYFQKRMFGRAVSPA